MRRAAPTMQEKRCGTLGSNRPGLRCDGPFAGPVKGAALARACQRWVGAVRDVGPLRCVVRSGHAATHRAAAGCRRGWSGMEAGVGDGMGAGCVAGRGCKAGIEPSCTVIFGCPRRAGSLLRVSWTDVLWPPGHLGTAAHLGRHRFCITCACAEISPCKATFEPRVRRLNSSKSSTYGTNRGPAHYRGQSPADDATKAGFASTAAGRGCEGRHSA